MILNFENFMNESFKNKMNLEDTYSVVASLLQSEKKEDFELALNIVKPYTNGKPIYLADTKSGINSIDEFQTIYNNVVLKRWFDGNKWQIIEDFKPLIILLDQVGYNSHFYALCINNGKRVCLWIYQSEDEDGNIDSQIEIEKEKDFFYTLNGKYRITNEYQLLHY